MVCRVLQAARLVHNGQRGVLLRVPGADSNNNDKLSSSSNKHTNSTYSNTSNT